MAVQTTVRKSTAAIVLHSASNEQLVYRITVTGAPPMFTLVNSDPKDVLLSHQSPNNPGVGGTTTYERQWPKPADPISVNSSHTLGMLFLSPIKYTYEVELYRSGVKVATLVDIDYLSLNKEDWIFEPINIISIP